MALVFVVSTLCAILLLGVVWALRLLWARLSGQPLRPWTFRVDPRGNWSRFYSVAGHWQRWSHRSSTETDQVVTGKRRREPVIIDVEPNSSKY